MSYKEHRHEAPASVNCAVLTVSDTRTEQDDTSGQLIKQRLDQGGHKTLSYAIVKDDTDSIKSAVNGLLEKQEIQVIITTGGTGVSQRDVTVETVSPILEKELDGFGELFRQLSFQEIGTASIMSRAIAGIARGKIILCLPGSIGAVTTAMDKIILPEIGHMVWEATK